MIERQKTALLAKPPRPANRLTTEQGGADCVVEPYLHFESEQIYNPLTDRTIAVADEGFGELFQLRGGDLRIADLDSALTGKLRLQGWLVGNSGDLATRFRLKYVALEANSSCNQSCYFCPVSTDPRDGHTMTLDFYESIVRQLGEYRQTIEAVSMVHYHYCPVNDSRAGGN